MKRMVLVVTLTLLSFPAISDVLYGANIVQLYTQSKLDGEVHMIKVDAAIPPQCNANRIYIPLDDKELYSSALAHYMSGKKVNLIYVLDGPPKTVVGHVAGIPCRVVSIF